MGIAKLDMPLAPPKKQEDSTKKLGRGIAFITYTTPKGAKAAIRFDGKAYEGQAVTVQAKGSSKTGNDGDRKEQHRVVVNGLPKKCEEAALRKHFEKCGEIEQLSIPMRKDKRGG